MRIDVISLLLTTSFLQTLSAQETLVFPASNGAVQNSSLNIQNKKSLLVQDTISLPFFDDFSRNTIFPNQDLWEDREVYVNFSYGIDPVSVGVATFDALNENGEIYPQASRLTFEADHLTSKPIRLNLLPTDGVYLSFYFQPQGIGDPPEAEDSLALLFYAPLQQRWDTVWHHSGDTLHPFRLVLLPINDTAFLHDGFRFRFVNYASLTPNDFDPGAIANCDHWNLDYIYLDKGRFDTDTLPRDIAFAAPIPSLLKSYEAMPWKQFQSTFLTEMGSVLPITYRNNDSIVRNVTREFRITELYSGQLSHSFSGGASNAISGSTVYYKAPLIYTFQAPGQDSALFEVKSFLITDDFDPKINDTIIRIQAFNDEYAYDDGSAEAGYGLNGAGMESASLAYRFHAYVPDTLKSVRIWFNRSKDDANLVYFNLVVWNDSSGIPGKVLHIQDGQIAVPSGGLSGFYTFPLDSLVIVDGDFYVGWQQVTSTFLNIGFDLNTDHHNNAFVYTSGTWKPSTIPGTIMIRPVLGRNDLLSYDSKPFTTASWHLYPNPADDYIYLKPKQATSSHSEVVIKIHSLNGSLLFTDKFSGIPVNISALKPGFYLLSLEIDGKPVFRSKFIKQ